MTSRSPDDVTVVLRKMIERDAHLAPVDQLECQVVNVREVLLQEGEHVMVGVHVQPYAFGANPVRHLETEHLGVPLHLPSDIAGEVVHVTELSRVPAWNARRMTDFRRPAIGRRIPWCEGDQVAVGITKRKRLSATGQNDCRERCPGRTQTLRCFLERYASSHLETHVIELRRITRRAKDERVVFVRASKDATAVRDDLAVQSEEMLPAGHCLGDVRDFQPCMVNSTNKRSRHCARPRPGAGRRPSLTRSRASSSGMASATCSVCSVTMG